MRRTILTLLFLTTAAGGALLGATHGLARIDLKLLDAQFQLLRSWFPERLAPRVVVVGIDERTVRELPEPIALWHQHIAQFLKAMRTARASAVGLDIVLPERSYDRIVPGYDKALMRGLFDARRSYPVVLARTVGPHGHPRPIYAPYLALVGPAGSGFALFPVDEDGVVRRFQDKLQAKGGYLPTLVGQLAKQLGAKPRSGFIDFWRGAPFHYVPLDRVLHWYSQGNTRALRRAFEGSPVLLGVILPFTDRLATPVSLAAWETKREDTPAVLVQAQALRNILGGGFIRPVPAIAVATTAALFALLWFIPGSLALATILLSGIAAVLFAVSTWLLTQGSYAPVSAPFATAVVALIGRGARDTLFKLRERRQLRASFQGYVSPEVMAEILGGRIRPGLGGERRFVCVMFSDIRGYTTRSEHMSPEQVISFLNRYYEEVVVIIHRHGGAVLSFMGDGIEAVFGAPKALDNPCSAAFAAARAMLAHVAAFNTQLRAEGKQSMDIGIALHAGDVVIGHVGASSRHEYAAIGDVTNVTARLEGLTKETRYRIVMSREVINRLSNTEEIAALGAMKIRGHSPVEVHGYDVK